MRVGEQPRKTRQIQHGDRTPWGQADFPDELGEGIYSISTPSHGGIYMGADARRAIPAEVRKTFMNGGAWAEEDCEMYIALALLEAKGKVEAQRLWLSVEKLRDGALKTARQYEQYKAAIPHLEKLMQQKSQPQQDSAPPLTDGAATTEA